MHGLIPDLLVAFERLLDDVDRDAGCDGKTALARTLKDLEHDDPAIFLRGLAHVQMEPVATVTALGGSPNPRAGEFLLRILAQEATELGVAALAALASSRFAGDIRERAESIVRTRNTPALARAYAEHFAK